ncbi:pyridine nucleotide-disulfide oxidoreductase [Erythrobacter litoralis]|uniref:FAD-dependent oxidoreductase n=1 Tax=Erythrobacter litoralis TaxID=39960 RepID=UPI002434C870|nr:FAD-dependent oxidoreductase [Erythrobacter litoralis]MDG6078344.1 pyridine nucleotide-disulfide oxidoreductase [Erythrobacter litoralis]
MRHIAIVGSGPAGYYTAEAAAKTWGDEVRIDIFDRLPVPFGLIRTGVAPDHQSIKAVSRRYEKTALADNVRFIGNITIGRDIEIAELQSLYDALILATGAPADRTLPIEGTHLSNVFGSAAFVGWYNGHPAFAELEPDLAGKNAVVIGVGNVALDVARILSKTSAEFAGSDIVGHAFDRLAVSNLERITILGRRGPHEIQMTPKELGELLHLERATPQVDSSDLPPPSEDETLEPGQRKSVALLREFAETVADKPISIHFDFFANPVRLVETNGAVSGVEVEETRLEGERAVGTGRTYIVPADIVVTCIGYRSMPIPGVPFDEQAGRFTNENGRITDGLYCVGWAKRGPTGTIGTNRPDGYGVMERVATDIGNSGDKPGRAGFDVLAKERGLDIVTFRDWQEIEKAEAAAAREGAPREKFVDIEQMIAARGGPSA